MAAGTASVYVNILERDIDYVFSCNSELLSAFGRVDNVS